MAQKSISRISKIRWFFSLFCEAIWMEWQRSLETTTIIKWIPSFVIHDFFCPVLICYLLFLLQIQSPFCLSISDAVYIQLTSSTHYFFSKAYFTGVASLVFFLPLLLFVSLYRFLSYFSVVNQVNWYSVPNWRNANEPTRVTVPGFFHLGEPLVCFYWPFFILVLNSKWGGG